MLRDGPAQRVRAVRRRGAQQRLALLAQHAAHELCPHGKGKVLRPAAAGAEIEQPRALRLRRAPGRGAPGRGGVPLHVGDIVAALLARVEIALRLELGIGVLHRDDRRLQMACKRALARQLFARRQAARENVLTDAAVKIIVARELAAPVKIVGEHGHLQSDSMKIY